jgi:hypothetical protein
MIHVMLTWPIFPFVLVCFAAGVVTAAESGNKKTLNILFLRLMQKVGNWIITQLMVVNI